MAMPRRQTGAHGHKNWETGNGTRPACEDLLPSLLRLPPLRDSEPKQGFAPGGSSRGKGYAESTERNDGVCSPCFSDCESAMVGTRREASLSCLEEKSVVSVFESCADRRLRVKSVRCCPVLPCQNVLDPIPLTGAGVIPVGIKEGFFRQRVVPARGSRPKRVLVHSLCGGCALDG